MRSRTALILLLVAILHAVQSFLIPITVPTRRRLMGVSQLKPLIYSLPQYIQDAAPVNDWLTCGDMADVSTCVPLNLSIPLLVPPFVAS